ncbi:MAG: hypothetical protein AAF228_12715 [Pseudomonadota bacterium]
MTLPNSAAVGTGKDYTFYKTSGANVLILQTVLSQSINGLFISGQTYKIFANGGIVKIRSDGANWYAVIDNRLSYPGDLITTNRVIAPSGTVFSYNQTLSRTVYDQAFDAITLLVTANTTSGGPDLTSVSGLEATGSYDDSDSIISASTEAMSSEALYEQLFYTETAEQALWYLVGAGQQRIYELLELLNGKRPETLSHFAQFFIAFGRTYSGYESLASALKQLEKRLPDFFESFLHVILSIDIEFFAKIIITGRDGIHTYLSLYPSLSFAKLIYSEYLVRLSAEEQNDFIIEVTRYNSRLATLFLAIIVDKNEGAKYTQIDSISNRDELDARLKSIASTDLRALYGMMGILYENEAVTTILDAINQVVSGIINSVSIALVIIGMARNGGFFSNPEAASQLWQQDFEAYSESIISELENTDNWPQDLLSIARTVVQFTNKDEIKRFLDRLRERNPVAFVGVLGHMSVMVKSWRQYVETLGGSSLYLGMPAISLSTGSDESLNSATLLTSSNGAYTLSIEVSDNASNAPEGTISYDLVIHGPNNSKTKLKSFLLPENHQGQIYINPHGYLVYNLVRL